MKGKILLFLIGLILVPFYLSSQTFYSTITDSIPILDDDCNNVVADTITTSGLGTLGVDFDIHSVCIDVTHTRVADLGIYLVPNVLHPGFAIQLVTGEGGNGDDFDGTCFSDTAATSIRDGVAPFVGYYMPEGSFEEFDSMSANANWILVICDNTANNTGYLHSWEITFGPPFAPIPTCPEPTDLDAVDIYGNGATLSWSHEGGASTYELEIGPSNFTPSGMPTNTVNDTFFDFTTGIPSSSYKYYVRAYCPVDDVYSDWVGPHSFFIPCGAYQAPYLHDFNPMLDDCWQEAYGVMGGAPWVYGQSDWGVDGCRNIGTFGSARVNMESASNVEWLISPQINLAGDTFYTTFDFSVNSPGDTTAGSFAWRDSLQFMISIAGSGVWTPIQIWDSTSLLPSTCSPQVFDLDPWLGEVVHFAWYAHGGAGVFNPVEVFVDNFAVLSSTCPAPNVLRAEPTISGGILSWDYFPDTDSFELEVIPASDNPSGVPTHVAGDTFLNFTGLEDEDYKYYVRAKCSNGVTSLYGGPYYFTTLCADRTTPWFEEFDVGGSLYFPPACWTEADNGHFSNGPENEGASWWRYGQDCNDDPGGARIPIFSSTQDWFISPVIQIGGSSPQLEFDISFNEFSFENDPVTLLEQDTLRLMIKEVDSTHWILLEQWGENNQGPYYCTRQTYDLSAWIGKSIQIAFWANSGSGPSSNADVSIDDLSIQEPPACSPPAWATVDSVVKRKVWLRWEGVAGASEYIVSYYKDFFGFDTFSFAATDTVFPLPIEDGIYSIEFYIQSVCGGDTSGIVGPIYTAVPPTYDECDCALMIDSLINYDGSCSLFYEEFFFGGEFTKSEDVSPPVDDNCVSVPDYRDIWFKMTVPPSGAFTFAYAPSVISGYVQAYHGDCGNLTMIPPAECSLDTTEYIGLTPGDTIILRLWWGFGSFNPEVCISTTGCSPPLSLAVDKLTPDTVRLGFESDLNTQSSFYYLGESPYSPSGISDFDGTGGTESLTLTGLTADTYYDLYLSAYCGPGDTSAISQKITFRVPCTLLGNDSASTIPVNAFPYMDIRRTDSCYTDEFDHPVYFVNNESPDVFYEIFTGPDTDSLIISTCGAETDFFNSFVLLDQSYNAIPDDNLDFCGPDPGHTAIADVDYNSTYYLLVKGTDDEEEGTYKLTISAVTNDNPCQQDVNVSGMATDPLYEAVETITSDALIPDSYNVIFRAGQSIELLGGFEVQSGAVFEAEIGDCD